MNCKLRKCIRPRHFYHWQPSVLGEVIYASDSDDDDQFFSLKRIARVDDDIVIPPSPTISSANESACSGLVSPIGPNSSVIDYEAKIVHSTPVSHDTLVENSSTKQCRISKPSDSSDDDDVPLSSLITSTRNGSTTNEVTEKAQTSGKNSVKIPAKKRLEYPSKQDPVCEHDGKKNPSKGQKTASKSHANAKVSKAAPKGQQDKYKSRGGQKSERHKSQQTSKNKKSGTTSKHSSNVVIEKNLLIKSPLSAPKKSLTKENEIKNSRTNKSNKRKAPESNVSNCVINTSKVPDSGPALNKDNGSGGMEDRGVDGVSEPKRKKQTNQNQQPSESVDDLNLIQKGECDGSTSVLTKSSLIKCSLGAPKKSLTKENAIGNSQGNQSSKRKAPESNVSNCGINTSKVPDAGPALNKDKGSGGMEDRGVDGVSEPKRKKQTNQNQQPSESVDDLNLIQKGDCDGSTSVLTKSSLIKCPLGASRKSLTKENAIENSQTNQSSKRKVLKSNENRSGPSTSKVEGSALAVNEDKGRCGLEDRGVDGEYRLKKKRQINIGQQLSETVDDSALIQNGDCDGSTSVAANSSLIKSTQGMHRQPLKEKNKIFNSQTNKPNKHKPQESDKSKSDTICKHLLKLTRSISAVNKNVASDAMECNVESPLVKNKPAIVSQLPTGSRPVSPLVQSQGCGGSLLSLEKEKSPLIASQNKVERKLSLLEKTSCDKLISGCTSSVVDPENPVNLSESKVSDGGNGFDLHLNDSSQNEEDTLLHLFGDDSFIDFASDILDLSQKDYCDNFDGIPQVEESASNEEEDVVAHTALALDLSNQSNIDKSGIVNNGNTFLSDVSGQFETPSSKVATVHEKKLLPSEKKLKNGKDKTKASNCAKRSKNNSEQNMENREVALNLPSSSSIVACVTLPEGAHISQQISSPTSHDVTATPDSHYSLRQRNRAPQIITSDSSDVDLSDDEGSDVEWSVRDPKINSGKEDLPSRHEGESEESDEDDVYLTLPHNELPAWKKKLAPPASRKKVNSKQRNADNSRAVEEIDLDQIWSNQDLVETERETREFPPPADTLANPLEYFKYFFDDEIVGIMTEFTNISSTVQRGGEKCLNVTPTEMRKFLGLLLYMGVVKMPAFRDYWATETQVPQVSKVMTFNRFISIRSNLHFYDKSQEDALDKTDRFCKVRVLMKHMKTKCNSIEQDSDMSIDESMLPYKGTYAGSLRQFIQNKPHRFGIKLYCLAGKSGLVYDFIPYAGASTFDGINFTDEEVEMGKGAQIVLHLARQIDYPANTALYFDNYFSSFKLVDYLKNKCNILSVGTVRKNRIDKCPLVDDKPLQSSGRGTYDYKVKNGVQITKWVDNKVVHVISTLAGVQPVGHAMRYDKHTKAKIDVSIPRCIELYNKGMGGVDLHDMLVELYRTPTRARRWYMTIISYMLDLAMVNAWVLYKRHANMLHEKPYYDLKHFRLEVSKELRGVTNPTPNLGPKIKNVIQSPRGFRPPDSSIYDGLHHWPSFTTTKGRCKHCGKHTTVICAKCDLNLCFVPLRQCFSKFHMPNGA